MHLLFKIHNVAKMHFEMYMFSKIKTKYEGKCYFQFSTYILFSFVLKYERIMPLMTQIAVRFERIDRFLVESILIIKFTNAVIDQEKVVCFMFQNSVVISNKQEKI